MDWYVEEMGDRACFQVLAGKPSARHPLGRPWRWEGNTVIPRLTSDPANEFFG